MKLGNRTVLQGRCTNSRYTTVIPSYFIIRTVIARVRTGFFITLPNICCLAASHFPLADVFCIRRKTFISGSTTRALRRWSMSSTPPDMLWSRSKSVSSRPSTTCIEIGRVVTRTEGISKPQGMVKRRGECRLLSLLRSP